MANDAPRKRRHLGAVVAVLLVCGVSFVIGAFVGASPTDPMGVKGMFGVPRTQSSADFSSAPIGVTASASATECPPVMKCEPAKEVVREVQVTTECPVCDACPSAQTTEETVAVVEEQGPTKEPTKTATATTNPLLATARTGTEPGDLQTGKSNDATGKKTTQGPETGDGGVKSGDIPELIQCPVCEACPACKKGKTVCADAPRCENETSAASDDAKAPATCPACDECPVCVTELTTCPKHEPCSSRR